MLKLFRNHKALFILVMVLSLINSVLAIAAAVILENILNAVVDGNGSLFTTMLWVTAGYIIALVIASTCGTVAEKKLIVSTVQDLRLDVQTGILSRDTEHYRTTNTADYLSALTNDIKIIEENIIVVFLNTIQYALVFVMAAIALFVYSPLIGGIMLVGLVLMYLLPASLGKPIGKRQEAYSANLSLFTTKLKDQFSGYEVIRSYRLVDQAKTAFSNLNAELTASKYGVDRLLALSEVIAGVMGAGLQIGTMLVAGFLVLNGQMSAGTLLAILQLSGTFVQPVAVILQGVPKIQGAQPVLARLEELSSPLPSNFAGSGEPTFEQEIKLENLCFGYTEDHPVLTGVNLTLKRGGKYVLVGESGCGKSTLVSLLGAEHSTYSGTIRIDGNELHDLDVDRLLASMSIIHQDVYVFDETIKYNICLGRFYSDEQWNRALRASGVDAFLAHTDQGINTKVGEMGANLSGGQRQRIAVARALIEEKPLLILDEGTNAVDIQTAYDIESALLEVEDLTLITITHTLRPELLRRYDAVLFMKQGRLHEIGAYDDLIEQDGGFASFQRLERIIEPHTQQDEVLPYEASAQPTL